MKFTNKQIRESMLLYAVTDRSWLKEDEQLVDVCEDILKKGVTFLQVREKELDKESFLNEAQELKLLCEKYKVPFVVNDDIDIALKINADGVHVGQSDIKGRDVRKIIGDDMILGISVGNVKEAKVAEEAGADYIGVGAVFGTTTKRDARNLSVEDLRKIAESVNIPVVAIGGISHKNISLLKGSKIDGVAVISAIFASENPEQATEELLEMAKEVIKDE